MKSVQLPDPLIEKSSQLKLKVQNLKSWPRAVSIRYAILSFCALSLLPSLSISQTKSVNSDITATQVPPVEPPPQEISVQTTAPKGQNATTDLKKIFKEAQELFKQKKYSDVKTKLIPYLDKLDQQRLSILTQAQFELKEYNEALRIAQMMISKNEKDETAYTLAGRIQLKLKKEKEALDSFKKALEINHKYSAAYDGLVELYEKRKNYYELALLYNEMIVHLGERNHFLNQLCDIYTKDELYDQAAKICKKAMQKDSEFADNYVNVGIIHRNQKEDKEAETNFKLAANKFSKSVLAQITYAQFLENKKDYLNSYKYFSNCLTLEPMNEACLVGHGSTAAQILKYEESLSSFKKACSLNRKNAVQVRKVLQNLRVEKQMQWIPKYEVLVEKCLSI